MKRVVIIILCLTIVVGSCIGGVFLYRENQKNNSNIEVVSVANIASQDWGSEMSMYGIATNQMMQEIYLNSDQRVLEVLVTEGDEVEIGTPLLKLDTTLAELELETKKIAVQKLDIDINNTKKELEKWKSTKPYVPATSPPPVVVPDTEEPTITVVEELSGMAQAYKGSGTQQDPYVFRCSPNGIIKASFFEEMVKGSLYTKMEVKPNGEDGSYYIWEMDGRELTKEPTMGETQGSTASEEETYSDWSIGTVEEEDGAVVLALNMQRPMVNANLKLVLETRPNADEETEIPNTDNELPPVEEPGYTQEELTKLITEAENKLKDYDLQKRQMVLACTLAEKKLEDTTIKSSVKGKVQSIEDENKEGKPFIRVNGGDGFYISGTISEVMLDNIKVGTSVQATSWGENGQQFYEAEITEIANYPTTESMGYGGGNPNASYYPFTAHIAEAEGLVNGMSMDLSVNVEGNTEAIFIDKAYVREEKGQYYVYAVNDQNQLEKRYVKTGKVLYDAYLEIKEGISLDDYLAFPYGKNVKSGVKVKLPEDNPIDLPNIQLGR